MFFSVIVPVYNVEKYLEDCIDSLIGQTFSDFEIVLVNDGSTDGSGDICECYRNKYDFIRLIHQKNAGLSCARNAGLEIARGTYIVFLDSDDYIADCDFLKKLHDKCAKNPDVILYGYKKYFESNQSFGDSVCEYPDVSNMDEPYKVIYSLLQVDRYDGSAWSKAVRTDLLRDNGIKFQPGIISEDSDWYLNVITCARKYDNINEAFVIYRQRATSISHAPKVKSLSDNINMLEKWTAKMEKMELTAEMQAAFRAVLARYYGNILILFALFPFKDVREYYPQMKKLNFLLKYSTTKRSKIIKAVSGVFGLRITVAILTVASKLRRRM